MTPELESSAKLMIYGWGAFVRLQHLAKEFSWVDCLCFSWQQSSASSPHESIRPHLLLVIIPRQLGKISCCDGLVSGFYHRFLLTMKKFLLVEIFDGFWAEYIICIVKTTKGERVLMRELVAPWIVAAVRQILGEFRKLLVKWVFWWCPGLCAAAWEPA